MINSWLWSPVIESYKTQISRYCSISEFGLFSDLFWTYSRSISCPVVFEQVTSVWTGSCYHRNQTSSAAVVADHFISAQMGSIPPVLYWSSNAPCLFNLWPTLSSKKLICEANFWNGSRSSLIVFPFLLRFSSVSVCIQNKTRDVFARQPHLPAVGGRRQPALWGRSRYR